MFDLIMFSIIHFCERSNYRLSMQGVQDQNYPLHAAQYTSHLAHSHIARLDLYYSPRDSRDFKVLLTLNGFIFVLTFRRIA